MLASADNHWVNTRDRNNLALLDKARVILAGVPYGAVSTCSPEGLPWVSPVFFTYDAGWNVYWSSAIAAQHSQNLMQNQGRCAIAIYATEAAEGKGQGIYLAGTAGILEDGAVPEVMANLFSRSGNWPDRIAEDYRGESPRRIYHFRPQRVWITGDRLPHGRQLIDTKVELDLDALRSLS